jgi:IS30 family transposase
VPPVLGTGCSSLEQIATMPPQEFPDRLDMRVTDHLAAVADELNHRPPKTLEWQSTHQRLVGS